MTDATPRYKCGKIKQTQDRANRRYRDRQQRMRGWVDEVAQELQLDRDQLLTRKNAELVVQLLRNHNPGS